MSYLKLREELRSEFKIIKFRWFKDEVENIIDEEWGYDIVRDICGIKDWDEFFNFVCEFSGEDEEMIEDFFDYYRNKN